MATYREPYVPLFRLVSSWSLSSKPVECFGYTIPSEFVCNFFIVSDNGKVIPKSVADTYPVFIVSMVIRVSEHGTPELVSVELKGETYAKQFPVGIDLRDHFFNDAEALTPWQLNYVANFRSLLISQAVESVANTWIYSIKDGKATWSYPITTTQRLSDSEKINLKKKVERRIRVQLTPDHYERVAKKYLEFIEAGLDPISELMKEFPDREHRTIQRWANEARQRGFLPKTTQGKVSRVPQKRKGKNANAKKAKSR